MNTDHPDPPAKDPRGRASTPDTSPVVLVVDDDDFARAVIARTLTSRGYHVVSASDGPQALQVVGEQRIDLVLMDLEMPRLSGLETVKRLRAQWPAEELPVIMLTGHSEQEMLMPALEAGASDVLGKPCPRDVLVAKVAERLAGR